MCNWLRSYDLDLNPVTLILDLDPDVLKIYLHAKRTLLVKAFKNQIPNRTDRQTHIQTDETECITTAHAQTVIMHF